MAKGEQGRTQEERILSSQRKVFVAKPYAEATDKSMLTTTTITTATMTVTVTTTAAVVTATMKCNDGDGVDGDDDFQLVP